MPTMNASPVAAAAGGSFLFETRIPADIFTPEDFNDEQRQIAVTAARFAREEIAPAIAAVEAREPGAMETLLRKAGELGFTAVDIPEEYGGVGMDKISSALITDHISMLASFSTAFGGHTGIATLPLVWYGTTEQKQRYLPKLATAEYIGAYALSESSSGSDAMNIRTHAVLSEDGTQYILNGEKQWITNGGIAHLFTVFAKIDGEKFSAFLVERDTPGLTLGKEEHKLGIRGSSTCSLTLKDCRIPVMNLLGEVGKGHHIAFNVLNAGRLKLGVACVGGARHVLTEMIRYAAERKAFGKAIAEFGLIQSKISAAAVQLFATESMAYRTVGMIDAALALLTEEQVRSPREIQRSMEEYAVECSILKVYGSEMMSLVADELVATMGGYGFVEDFAAERHYRDARINRIFEGTNEINRLIISGWLLKRAVSGKLPLLAAIQRMMDEITQPFSFNIATENDALLAREADALVATRKMGLFASGVASQRYGMTLQDQQEIMAELASIFTGIYALESTLLRAQKMTDAKAASAQAAADITGLLAEEVFGQIELSVRKVLSACSEGDELQTQRAILRRLAKITPVDTIRLSRAVAHACGETMRYPF